MIKHTDMIVDASNLFFSMVAGGAKNEIYSTPEEKLGMAIHVSLQIGRAHV